MQSMNFDTHRDAGYAYCEKHLTECCRELLEYSSTGILGDGHVRELARHFSFAGNHAQAMAESVVKQAAMQAVVAAKQ